MARARPRLAARPPAWQSYPVTSAQPADPAGKPSPYVRIVHLSAPVFRALADGDLAAANAASPVSLPA
jgi:hypothetical protein